MFSTSDDVAPAVIAAVENALSLFARASVHDVLEIIEDVVVAALNGSDVHTPEQSQNVIELTDSDEDSIMYEDPSDWDDDDTCFPSISRDLSTLHQNIRRDLRAAKSAGFKVGYQGDIHGSITLSISSRIRKLDISEEAMKTWSVRSADYLVLLIRYPRAYHDLQELHGLGDSATSLVQMHLGLCSSYKPSPQAILDAFQGAMTAEKGSPVQAMADKNGLRGLFIGAQLNALLNERFMEIVKFRIAYGLSWTGAEYFFHASQGKHLGPDDASAPEFNVPDTWGTPPPAFLVSDHMAEMGLALSKISLPLLAMQFALRHFVKCTEFCLVCHCKKHYDFEALKPYVCSNGLCLYQHITFGMGRTLEYEIRFQPYVVDLLVCLVYARAKASRLVDFPSGLGLRVPDITLPGPVDLGGDELKSTPSKYHWAMLDPKQMTLSRDRASQLTVGDWIVILGRTEGFKANLVQAFEGAWHCRIQRIDEISGQFYVSQPLWLSKLSSAEQVVRTVTKEWEGPRWVAYVIYNKNFDELTPERKQTSTVMLLNTLPSIDTMVKYLELHGSDGDLSSWQSRITPASLNLLRWIVASNRSCILQDSSDPEHLVSGMHGYIQFRLVQGAPDKEQRFIQAINQNFAGQNPKHPTLFAWHGSPVYNWHSILREGLHYNTIANGRACGNGVYMSNHFATSKGYSSLGSLHANWPQSNLSLQSVISLNEVVNVPKRFVCISPHYVVQHLDWIQPRYLFVGTGNSIGINQAQTNQNLSPGLVPVWGANMSESSVPSVIYEQDPLYRVRGPAGKDIQIPISALSSKRRESLGLLEPASSTSRNTKSRKSKKHVHSSPSKDDDDLASISTAMEDLSLLLSDSDQEMTVIPSKKKDSTKQPADDDVPQPDFVPGTLQEGSLPLLSPPRYATTFATKVLQSQLQATLKVQAKAKLHELGWYVDPSLIKTVYQWIVELHTFDPSLPLAQDLKAAKLQSVILELRFPPGFPMGPPFVRVLRPRFLLFNAGGGGHITMGGALCMELLTNSGWTSVISMESLLLQVRMAICSTEPRPARLAHSGYDYAVGEAVESYKRACMMHGWEIPKDLEHISW